MEKSYFVYTNVIKDSIAWLSTDGNIRSGVMKDERIYVMDRDLYYALIQQPKPQGPTWRILDGNHRVMAFRDLHVLILLHRCSVLIQH